MAMALPVLQKDGKSRWWDCSFQYFTSGDSTIPDSAIKIVLCWNGDKIWVPCNPEAAVKLKEQRNDLLDKMQEIKIVLDKTLKKVPVNSEYARGFEGASNYMDLAFRLVRSCSALKGNCNLALLGSESGITATGQKRKADGEETPRKKRATQTKDPSSELDKQVLKSKQMFKNSMGKKWKNLMAADGKVLKSEEALQAHREACYDAGEWKCSKKDCGYSCTTETGMKAHFRKIHLGIWQYPCPFVDKDDEDMTRLCPRKYEEQAALKKHFEDTHDLKTDLRHSCGKGFSSKRKLEMHARICGTEDKPWVCCVCKVSFRQADTLKQHMKTSHGTKVRYTCSTCLRKYRSEGSRKRHMCTGPPKQNEDPNEETSGTSSDENDPPYNPADDD